ncbi:OsmC family protein [Aquipseudomonas ullengensis]|uniref:OsmC family protein n=1 Tax=Aquipseudomonas ullengensis TaxID=2759166 RepID=A0A7W4LN72_9GAMM|nr:OsmC family protein [Pseudomonas ullengensis]MBB2496266.1 OsmC family protein [Pseudomonas ullengensis]
MIRISTESGMRHSIEIGDHLLHTDVPVEYGGNASGPEPHDLFDAALGACKALTLMLYAKQKGLPLEGLDVRVNRDDSEERQGIYRLAVELDLHGALDDAQREQLLRVADRCPVQKLITSADVQISTRLGEV